jgi:beta-fructofuranosidase
MVHWERLPPALIPDTEYDYDGVFSGSATILDDGTPVLFYTGGIAAWLSWSPIASAGT